MVVGSEVLRLGANEIELKGLLVTTGLAFTDGFCVVMLRTDDVYAVG
jgi:hypothetical protein